jgi:hypothetical protein
VCVLLDEKDRRAALVDLLDDAKDDLDDLWCEAQRRFVEQQDARLAK